MRAQVLSILAITILTPLNLLRQTNSDEGSVSNELRIANLQTIVGKQLYACSDAKLVDLLKPSEQQAPGLMPKALLDRRPVAKLLPFEIPILKPLIIIEAIAVRGIEVSGLQNVNLIFDLGSGRKVGADGYLPTAGPLLEGDGLLKELTSRNANNLLLARPQWYRPETADTLQVQSPQKGMSRDEVECSVGKPENVNDYGNGGDQWVYDHGTTFVYFSSDTGLVVDIQHMGI